jgi:hypothetical protein
MKEIEQHLRLLARYSVDCVIVGGVAAHVYGSTQLTYDLDICYNRELANLLRITEALRSVDVHLRGAPKDLPFILDAETLRRGLNFTFETTIGALDLLGEMAGVGGYPQARENAEVRLLFGLSFLVLSLPKLIEAKRAAGRAKDRTAVAELEAIYEVQKSGEAKD